MYHEVEKVTKETPTFPAESMWGQNKPSSLQQVSPRGFRHAEGFHVRAAEQREPGGKWIRCRCLQRQP